MNRSPLRVLAPLALFALSACTASPGASPSPSLPAASQAASASPSAAAPSPSSTASAVSSPTPTAPPSFAPNPAPPEGADCGKGEAAFKRAVRDVDNGLAFAGSGGEFTTAAIRMRNGSWTVDDAIPAFVGLTDELEAVKLSPRATERLNGPSNLALITAIVGAYRWSSIAFAPGQLADPQEPPTPLLAKPDGKRSIDVTAPSAPGEYALEFGVRWMTGCLHGDGVMYARIVVK